MILIDKLSYSSGLRKEHAGMKCFFSVFTLILCIASRSIPVAFATLLMSGWLIVRKGRISLSYFLRLLCIPLVFLFLSTIAILVQYADQPFSWFAIPIFKGYLTVSPSSFFRALQLISTALASVSCLFFLSLTTPLTDILSVLNQIHLPELLIELMFLIYRFIFVLLDYADALHIAQKSRLGNKDFKTSLFSFGKLVSILLIRSLKKASHLYDAMESRCYNGKIKFLRQEQVFSKKNFFFGLFFEAILILLIFIF